MMKRLWPFLLLNVVVSATTVVIVLLIWNASHSSSQLTDVNGTFVASTSLSAVSQATLPALNAKLFDIQAVFGAGDLENEYIHFLYLGSEPLNLENWQVQDEHQHKFIFPAFVIYKNGAFDLYTKGGTDSTIELYMAQAAALWQSGETITLLDPAGNKRLTYQIP
jgi:Lamin Tail Domain